MNFQDQASEMNSFASNGNSVLTY